MGFRIDLTNDTEETVERGDQPGPGWYLAKLEDVYEDVAKAGATVLKFKIAVGEYEGRTQFDRLFDPNLADDEKAKKSTQRIKMVAHRLGLIGEGDYGGEAEIDFVNAIGWEGFLRIETNKNSGYTGIAYNGIFPLDYPKDKFPKDFPEDMNGLRTGPDKAPVPEKKGRGAASGGRSGGTATATAAPPRTRRTVTEDDL